MENSEQTINDAGSSAGLSNFFTQMMIAGGNIKGNFEFENRINDSAKMIDEKCKTSITDSYGNSLLDIGNVSETSRFTNYTFTNDTLNWPLWLALYNESWVFKRAIDKPAQDEIRCGIAIEGDYDKDDIYRKLKNYRTDLIQLLSWGALFGGSIAIAMFDNFENEDYKKPFNKEKVKKAKVLKFYVVDRWYGVAPDYDNVVDNMADIDYGKPKYYNVTMPDGTTYKYHHDYVIRYEHRTAPKLIKNGMLQGWGYSEGSHLINELMRDEKLKASIQSLMDKALIEVIKMDGMRGVFMGTDKKNEAQLTKRLEMVNWGRNFNSLTFLDKNDDYEMKGFSGLTGLADLLQQNMWLISSALEMQGILFGDLKNGFSVDNTALERYDEVINGRCENYVRPVYTKLLKYIYTMLEIDEKIEFSFNSLLTKQQDTEKMESLQRFVNLGTELLNDGVINTKQFAKALQQYSLKSVIDFGLTDEAINKLEEDFENQMENIDIESGPKAEVGNTNIDIKGGLR